jgi:hypothetical protein
MPLRDRHVEYILDAVQRVLLLKSDDEEIDLGFISELDDLLLKLNTDVQKTMVINSSAMEIKVKKTHPNAVIPSYSKDGDAGMDLTITEIINQTNGDVTYGFGIAMEIPRGYVGLIFPRSSVRKYDLLLSNAVGVVDCVPSGTKIKTINGDINVEDLFENISIPILSYNEELNSIETDMVTDMWIVENKDLLRITTEDGDIVELPHEKEVFTKSGWKKVFDLTENDEILRFM